MEYDPMEYLCIQVNREENHIQIKKEDLCERKCENKSCTLICPTGVYHWQQKLAVRYWRCLECGACQIVCPNISWSFPSPPYGVSYKKN